MDEMDEIYEMDDGYEAPDPEPPADAAEAMDRLRGLFAECEASARQFFRYAVSDGLDFDIRCAYAGLAGRLVRAASGIAGRLERSERSVSQPNRS